MNRQGFAETLDLAAPAPAERAERDLAAGLYARRGKRALDTVLILLAAPFVLPVVALLALLVALDGGPAFYGQTRLGKGGRPFTCWKLRSMAVDAAARLAALLAEDPAAAAEWARSQKLSRDPRITPLGRRLRAVSFDELPQLWNVLRGEMALVGPRPMTPEQAPIYPGRAYFAVRPGLTGPWQVSERHESAFAGRAGYDAAYVRDLSLASDIRLLARTVGVVLRGQGA